MGFGFSEQKEDEEGKDAGPNIKHKQKDKLIYLDWPRVLIGTRVQSLNTATKGTIVSKDDEWHEIIVEWDNGKTSKTSQKYYDKVIVI